MVRWIVLRRALSITGATLSSKWAHYIPWWLKSKRVGRSLLGAPAWRESGNLVAGSRSSSKNGCTMASIADNRCVGVYSNSRAIKSIALGSALRKTCSCRERDFPTSNSRYLSYLAKGVRLDLREFMFHVIGIHGTDLVACRSAQDLDNFHQLIDTRLSREKRLTQHEFRHHTAGRPNIYEGVSVLRSGSKAIRPTDLGGVVCCAKDEFGRTVVP